jgi:hypothetical protein
MDKIYKITLVCLLVILFLANIVFFVYDGKFVSYFETKEELETAQNILNNSDLEILDNQFGFFNLAILENEKYQNLKDFKFDLDDFSLPGSTSSEGISGEDQDQPEKEPDFAIGNSDPFSPSF